MKEIRITMSDESFAILKEIQDKHGLQLKKLYSLAIEKGVIKLQRIFK